MKYYLSGSISNGGTKKSTFERFYEAAKRLRQEGNIVFNPPEWEQVEEMSWEWYLARDTKLIFDEKPVLYMLVGWEVSSGARLEFWFARLLGLTIEFEPGAKRYEMLKPTKWEQFMAKALKMLYETRPILYLGVGWENSRKAKLEFESAKLLDLTVEFEPPLEQPQTRPKRLRQSLKRCQKQLIPQCG